MGKRSVSTVSVKDSQILRECPFCGGEARHYAPGPIDHHIECVECYADIHRDTEAEAIAAWNSRAERTCKHDRMFNLVERECDGKWYSWRDMDMPRYCPNCGARVMGE